MSQPPTPTLAVVGFVNMGKSSLVAALTETDAVAIAAPAGTTTDIQRFSCVAAGQTLFELVDTPGFQAARRALHWIEGYLERHGEESVSGVDALRAFLASHAEDALYVNECRLLRPILEGAGVLYVADAGVPYKARYEAEMRILALTGRPRLAVLNLRGEAIHRDKWREALAANFQRVHAIDVVDSTPEERRAVLRALRDIEPGWQPTFDRALARIDDEHHQRHHRAAEELADLVLGCLSARRCAALPDDHQRSATERRLRQGLKQDLVEREARSRTRVEALYRFTRLEREETGLPVLDEDLFAERVWRLLGLSKRRLIAASTAAGAGTGGLVDLDDSGCLSIFVANLGKMLLRRPMKNDEVQPVVSAGIGFASGLAATRLRFGVGVLGRDLLGEGEQLCVRAPTSLKFASVLLDRALVHYRLVQQRSHADRRLLHIDPQAAIIEDLGGEEQRALASLVEATGASEGPADEELRTRWLHWIERALQRVREQGGIAPTRPG